MTSTEQERIGWLCSYTPIELIVAAGFMPYRISGHVESPRAADTYMSPNMCQFVRSVVDNVAGGKYDDLRGVIFVNSCDPMRRLHDVWKRLRPGQFIYMVDLPVNQSQADQEYFTMEVGKLKDALEEISALEITDADMTSASRTLLQARELYHDLLGTQSSTPPLLSSTRMRKITDRFFTTPLDSWAKEVKSLLAKNPDEDNSHPVEGNPRILLAGSPSHDPALVALIQESGMDVVFENTCTGSRFFDIIVDDTGNPIINLGSAYFNKPTCARMMQLSDRANFIIEKARQFGVDGIIHFTLKFCDTYQYDVPELKKMLEVAGLKVLSIEADCLSSNSGQLKTRFESFKEMLQNKEGASP
jgi:benzoyl-CoA reductase/2-hydroxyglutaryl-CoA dehydratase subunit BcrC/BadD/HgdB